MTINDAAELHRTWAARFNGKDLDGMVALAEVDSVFVPLSGDIALLISDWSLKGKGADGSDVNISGTTADVARRGREGWKYVIDNPFGTI